MRILVTGGTGFIGSHTCVELLDAGYDIVVFDNFYNSKPEVVDTIKKITGKDFTFYQADMMDMAAMTEIFDKHEIDAVIHFAGYKAVGESVEKPLMYYQNNLIGTMNLLEAMKAHGVKKLVFSSSATVYGTPERVPITEDFPLSVTNPYGRTKLMIEDMLRDLYVSDPAWTIVLLRYFNPVGAHKSGLLCEDPNGIPNNLMPRIVDAALGKMPYLTVFGDDYDTKDGTGVRDYIHVVDLSKGHLKALEAMVKGPFIEAVNLGTGNGYSVLEMIHTFENVNGIRVPYKIMARRSGDVAACYANPAKAANFLNWSAELSLEDMCKDVVHALKTRGLV